MKRLIFFFVLFFLSVHGYSQIWQWAQNSGGSSTDIGYGIAVDALGNTYATGFFQGTSTFGSTTLTSYGGQDIFVAKYDSSGTVLWAQKSGSSSSERGQDIVVDGSGNSYVTGYFPGTATFGGFTITSSGSNDVFTVKYDSSGTVLWAQKAGGSSSDIGYGIAVDATGNSYVTGYFRGTANFGGFTLTSSGSSADVFTVKYDSSGTVLWAQKAGGSSSDIGYAIAVDGTGNSYVTGFFEGTSNFGGNTLTSSGSRDIFTVKYDATGNVLWARRGGGSLWDEGNSIAVDTAGNSYITGSFEGAATFGGFNFTSSGGYDVFTLKYDSSGSVVWARKGGGSGVGSGNDIGNGIAVEATGNSYVTGYFQGTATFGGFTLTSVGGADVFTVKYDAAGNVLWTQKGGGSGNDIAYGIVVDGSGNSYAAGYFLGTASFGGDTLTSSGANDLFVAKIVTCDTPGIITQPAAATVCSGSIVTLTVAATGTGLSYQWKRDTTNVGTDSPTLTLNNVSVADAGSYSVVVTGTCGSETSASASLTVPVPSGTPTSGQTGSCFMSGGFDWHYLLDGSDRILAMINPQGQNLGMVTADVYVDPAPGFIDKAYMQRHWRINSSDTAWYGNTINIRLPFKSSELSNLITEANSNSTSVDDISNITDLYATKYSHPSGTGEDDVFDDNVPGSSTSILTQIGNNIVGSDTNWVEFNISSFSEFWLHGSQNLTPLPVSLTFFEAMLSGESVSLLWSTTGLPSLKSFVVQKTNDGIQYTDLEEVEASYGSARLDYQITDPYPKKGENFYRLKLKYEDERILYSAHKLIIFGERNEVAVRLYPNPASSSFTLEAKDLIGEKRMTLMDISGKTLRKESFSGKKHRIAIDDLPKGMYLLRLNHQGANTVQKLIVE